MKVLDEGVDVPAAHRGVSCLHPAPSSESGSSGGVASFATHLARPSLDSMTSSWCHRMQETPPAPPCSSPNFDAPNTLRRMRRTRTTTVDREIRSLQSRTTSNLNPPSDVLGWGR